MGKDERHTGRRPGNHRSGASSAHRRPRDNRLPQDRGDRLVGLERELPFLPHVIRPGGFWPDDQHQPLARGDRVLYFLVKRQPARRHRDAVKPNLETVGREIPVQPGNEGRCRVEQIDVIAARLGEKDAGIAVVPYQFGRPRISFTIGVQETEALSSDEGPESSSMN